MSEGTIQRLISIFNRAFQQLNVEVDLNTLENLAVLIHKAMTVQARNYHSLDHVFTFVDEGDPIATLAALFHDIVYYQIDLGFLPEIQEVISSYIHQEEKNFRILQNRFTQDRPLVLALGVFDLQPGQSLRPETGLNEFLSALVMNKHLDGIVAEKDLLKMGFCIEATMPFRGLSLDGENPFNRLEDRLRRLVRQFGIVMQDDEIEGAICTAVRIANIDVASFAELDVTRFLESTWKLLPEMNVSLRSGEVYTIRQYRQALESTENFFRTVDPNTIFHSYKGEPPEDEFQYMVERARTNITMGGQYLSVKLLAQAILEALAEVSGGDAPLSLFTGDLPKTGERTQRLEDFLPDAPVPEWLDPGSVIYKLLTTGRVGEQPAFDLTTSPTSAFVYKMLPPQEIERSLGLTRDLFGGRIDAQDFLRQLDPAVVGPIARACASMVFTRSGQLLKYAG
jgi:hypothetical protein